MRYLVALVLPPLAVLICGKVIQALMNVVLCLLFVVPGVVHALFVANKYYADQRHKKFIHELKGLRR